MTVEIIDCYSLESLLRWLHEDGWTIDLAEQLEPRKWKLKAHKPIEETNDNAKCRSAIQS